MNTKMLQLLGISLIVSISILQISSFRHFLSQHNLHSTQLSKTKVVWMSRGFPDNRNQGPKTPPPPINEFIKVPTVRLLLPKDDDNGEPGEFMAGIFSIEDALEQARALDLDLGNRSLINFHFGYIITIFTDLNLKYYCIVLINDKSDPPICKAIDYGKFKYSQEKKKKENLKKQVKSDIKEVKMSYSIDSHDFDVRVRAVQKFLSDGDRVSIDIVLHIDAKMTPKHLSGFTFQ